VVGSYNDFTDLGDAAYWKNDTLTILKNGSNSSSGTAIAVSGSDIYVSGISNGQPCYWKNGTFVSLGSSGSTSGIGIIGQDVYVSGSTSSGTAVYWKNGIPVTLSPDSGTNYANDLVINGNDVYIVGDLHSNYFQTQIATIWKNGVAMNLTDGSRFAVANGICVSGSDVYACGGELDESGSYIKAEYWKNGTRFILSDSSCVSVANGITVSGTDVYVGGNRTAGKIISTNGYDTAVLWKNAIPTSISNASIGAYIYNLASFQSDIYFSYWKSPGNGNNTATYYKNSSLFSITDAKKNSSTTARILVIPKTR
jgi:predicted RecA/RadA family phage recombinase